VIDPFAKRFNAIRSDHKCVLNISNYPEIAEGVSVPYHPKNKDLGNWVWLYTNKLFVEEDDIKGLNIGEKFTLWELGNCYIDEISLDGDKILSANVTMHPEDKEIKSTRKVCWVPFNPDLHIEIDYIEYD